MHFCISAFLHFYISTFLHFYISTFIQFYISIFLYFYISTFLHLYICIFLYRCAKHCRRPFQKDIHHWLRAGTLPANLVPTNIEIQGGTLPKFLFWTLVVRAEQSTLPKFPPHLCVFFVILEIILVILAVRAPLWLSRGPRGRPTQPRDDFATFC